MDKAHGLFVMGLALLAPVAMAQQHSTPPTIPSSLQQQMQNTQRESAHNTKAMQLGDRQAERNALTNLTKLRAGLATAWQQMGLSPQAAQRVADSYDPTLVAQMHHTSLRGKSDAQMAEMLRDAVAANRFLVADQLLIDYQRQKLSLRELAAGDKNESVSGR